MVGRLDADDAGLERRVVLPHPVQEVQLGHRGAEQQNLAAPRQYDGLEPAFEAAARARIPIVLVDREAAGRPGRDYLTFLGSDFVSQGRRAATWLVGRTAGRARIMELSGTLGSSVARDRAS